MKRSRVIGKKSLCLFLALQLALGLFGAQLAAANDSQSASNSSEDSQVQSSIKGELSAPLVNDQSVLQYLATNKRSIGVSDPASDLTMKQKTVDSAGRTHYLYQLQVDGIPVYGKYIRVHLNKSKRVTEIRNQVAESPLPQIPKTLTPELSSEDAIHALERHLEETLGFEIQSETTINGKLVTSPPDSTLTIYPFQGKSYLAYETELSYLEPKAGSWIAYVDANSGDIIDKYDRMAEVEAKALIKGVDENNTERWLNVVFDDMGDEDSENNIYVLEDRSRDMYEDDTNTGAIVTFDAGDWGPPVTTPESDVAFIDTDEVNAHYYSGVVYEYFKENHNRNSIDGNGMDILSLVHYMEDGSDADQLPDPYDNAFWSGDVMVYGDGSCYTCALDVIGHEMVHGITQYTSNLEYRYQSGALNESFSDIFGALIEMDFENTANDWVIGEDTGEVVRDLANPELYNQPATMNDFYYTSLGFDQGGVHINSGIPNHAAYLTATGIDEIGLDGKQILGQLSYDVLSNRLMPNSNFEDARDAFVSAAEDYASVHPGTQGIVQKVKDAWAAVGLPYGSRHDITSLQGDGISSVWIDANSNEIYVNASSPETIRTGIEVSPGAVLREGSWKYYAEGDYYAGTYTVSSAGTTVEWIIFVYDYAPYLTYNWNYSGRNYYEVDVDIGQIGGEVLIELHNDIFAGEEGEDFLRTGKAIVSPVPEGLVPYTMLVRNRLYLWFLGEAVHHDNRDDVTNFSIRFMDSAFKYSNAYQVANNYKNDMVIDMKSPLRITEITETTASFEWPALSDATGFQLFQSTNNGLSWDLPAVSTALNGSSTTATISELLPNTFYRFKLVTTGGEDAGESIWSATYTLSPGTYVPAVANPIADRTAIAGGEDLVIALDGTITDKDKHDIIVYETAYSSNSNMAEVSLQYGVLTIHPLQAGRVEIVVNAHDGWGHYAQDRFFVYIDPPPNQAPEIFRGVAGQFAYVEGADVSVSLSNVFKDPDGDNLTFTAVSNAPDKASVIVNGNSLRIHPESPGTAIITLTANDGQGHTTAVQFAVTVKPPNQPSTIANQIADQEATSAGQELTIPLLGVFADPDGDPLRFSASSNSRQVASVKVVGNTLKVKTMEAGTAAIRVTANDGNRNTVSDIFLVTQSTAAVNRSPIINSPIADKTATAGSPKISIQSTSVFSDPDPADRLTYLVTSSQPSVASASMSGSLVVVNPLAAGTATITVTATDSSGSSVSDAFVVTVSAAAVNRSPIVNSPIADKTATAGGSQISIASTTVFSDPDQGDILTYSVTSSRSDVASVNMNGSLVVVNPLAAGTATITVTATDSSGSSVSDAFVVTVSAAPTPTVPDTGGGGGGGGGVPAIPPVVPDEEGTEEGTDPTIDDEGIHLNPDEDNIQTVLSTDGTKNMTISVEAGDLEKALNAMSDADSKPVILKASNSEGKTNFELPAGPLEKASQKNKDGVISIRTDQASLNLPLNALDFEDLARKTGNSIDKVTIVVSLSAPSKAEEQAIRDQGQSQGLTFLSIVDFTVSAEAGGKSVAVSDFGSTYVPRTIVVSETDGNKRLLAVIIDPKTGEAQFIPATIKVENGVTTVVISAPHASVYGVVEAKKVTFADIQNHAAKSEIEALASALLIKGTSATTFSPERSITRAEFAALLTRALGLDAKTGVSKFNDVKETLWFAPSVNAAVRAGIINGKSSTIFDPNATIKREEMAVMVSRAIAFAGKKINLAGSKENSFADGEQISGWAKKAILQGIEAGLYESGQSENFRPQENATRAEAAVILKNMLDYLQFID
ncbi:M4 family metallopeptidase [Paenibacillus sp. LHD-117]|uniref:M4 family metallopeptidase n=1 Tax=Paenibacillus sp. LHD-117 TaxID=3071412 RepID=UPI0027DED7CF|nr:M4 family metallopeptidase [Paenibacillus sp. LHD-117]MDQ6423064.1 M4 family metallopeptidase [Paenibacillus sp. LHD-117]